MLDYLSHFACLQSIRAEIAARLATAPTPKLQAVSDAVEKALPLAVLGALTDRLFEHADGTADQELALLEKAAAIWPDITSLIDRVAVIRNTLEDIVKDPMQADVVSKFNAVSTGLTSTEPIFMALTAKLQAYNAELLPQDFAKQHGQQLDQPAANWTFRDIALSRRTGLFAANVAQLARRRRDDDAIAFSYGVLAGYAGNVVGSAFLNETIGGPRRIHPYRSRLAENVVGAFLDDINPSTSASGLFALTSKITFGSPSSPSLPPGIEKLLSDAISQTYSDKVAVVPDLQEAYGKLIRHLELLNRFELGPPPQPIDAALSVKIAALSPQDKEASGSPAAPGTPGGPPAPAPSSASSTDHSWTYYVAVAACFVLTAACYLIGLCSNSNGQNAPKYPDPTTSDPGGVGQAQSYLKSEDATVQVNRVFNLHVTLYELALATQTVMKVLGLIYPTFVELGKSMYSQFLVSPPNPTILAAFTDTLRPIPDPAFITRVPTSAPEHPTPAGLNPFPTGTLPTVFLTVGAGGAVPAVSQYGAQLWMLEAINSDDSDVRRTNRNLDSDRGPFHECWSVPVGKIGVDPLPTLTILGYTDF